MPELHHALHLSMRRVRSSVFVAALVALTAAVTLVTGRPAQSAPALWLVQTAHSKVYLFGTVHVLRPETQWRSTTLDSAIAESRDLWLEIANPDDTMAAMPLLSSLGTDPDHPLSTKVSANDLARIDRAAKAIGTPGEAVLEPLKPWVVSITLSVAPLIQAGYDPQSGVDLKLRDEFQSAGKPVHGFESLETQMHYLADMPENQQVLMLDSTLDEIDSASATLDALVSAWANGDIDRFAAITQRETYKTPQLYQSLVVRRNARFAAEIATILKSPGVSIVAIGAAHLSGGASVQAYLEQLGYRVTRVQ